MAKYDVYLRTGNKSGLFDWVGITKNIEMRRLAHAAEGVIKRYAQNVGYRQARLLEVNLIKLLEQNGFILKNIQKNIDAAKLKSKYTKEQIDWAQEMAGKLWQKIRNQR